MSEFRAEELDGFEMWKSLIILLQSASLMKFLPKICYLCPPLCTNFNFSDRKQTTVEFFKNCDRKVKFQLEFCSQKQPALPIFSLPGSMILKTKYL